MARRWAAYQDRHHARSVSRWNCDSRDDQECVAASYQGTFVRETSPGLSSLPEVILPHRTLTTEWERAAWSRCWLVEKASISAPNKTARNATE
jgi:hypothetical protein